MVWIVNYFESLMKIEEEYESTGKGFITDFGESIEGKDLETGKVDMVLPRFAYWDEIDRGKPQVVESSDDLDYLMKKYNVPSEKVVKI